MPVYKSASLDKIDAYMPKGPPFIHDNYYLSRQQQHFHYANGYKYSSQHDAGQHYGISKRLWKASPDGYLVDDYAGYTGKSDE